MNNSMITASVSMNALQQKLDVIANNMANVDTNGYKRKEASFMDVLANVRQQKKDFNQPGRQTPLGLYQGWGSRLSLTQIDLTQGVVKSTGLPYDMAIQGNGLFEVAVTEKDAQGQDVNRRAWTRSGAFHLSETGNLADSFSYLTTSDGYKVMGTDADGTEHPIRIPKNARIAIDQQGNIRAYDQVSGNELFPDPPIGRLKLAEVIKPQNLEMAGDDLLTVGFGVNTADVLQDIDFNKVRMNPITVQQGFLEQSNVNLSTEMTDMMEVQRAYQLNARALSSSDTMMNLANNLRS